ncbi:glutathione S-transferase [Allostella vacuolata]|nr:glutathione S-transferase [Stella vacuolata]
MSVEIYWGSGSPFAWRVLLAAEVKGVPYTSHLLSFQARDHKAPAFLAINPRGKVPVLKDGDRVVTESMAIMHHLDAIGGGPSLFGTTADERTAVWEWSSRILYDLEEAVDAFTRPLIFAKPGSNPGEAAMAALPRLQAELAGFEAVLADRKWLCDGDAPSAADLAAFPFLMNIGRAVGKDAARGLELPFTPLSAHYPNLAAWQARIEALPGYERTYPPHWREG